MKRAGLAAVAALAVSASAAFAAPIVVNGSFEMSPGGAGLNGRNFDDLPGLGGAGWDIYASLPGWNHDNDGIEVQTAGVIPLDPADGNYYAELDGNSNTTINQDVVLDIGKYLLSFYYSPRVDSPSTNLIDFGLDGFLPSSVNGPGIGGTAIGVWTLVTAEYNITTAGTYNLYFGAGSKSDSYGGFIDNISLAPVPLPAGGLLLMAGLGGLALVRRRSTKA